jgi:hypothetical protein
MFFKKKKKVLFNEMDELLEILPNVGKVSFINSW